MTFFLKATYPIFFLISLAFPRKESIWVFGNQKRYFDNTRYFFEYVSDTSEIISAYWLANTLDELNEVSQLGYQAVLKNSFKGYWIASRAGFSFICNGFSDVSRLLALKSKVISFWHGTPIKKIYLDSKQDLQKLGSNKFSIFLSSLILRFLNSNINFYYASNEFERVKVTAAAAIKLEKSLALGVPRFDFMRISTPSDKILELTKNKNVILFSPTWRKNEAWSERHVITAAEYAELKNLLASSNSLFIVKLHPLTKKEKFLSMGLLPSKNIIYSDDYGIDDINSLYSVSDLMITDLSSTIFDFCMFNKPILIFMPDYKNYIEGERGVYDEFVRLLEKNSLVSWKSLMEAISSNSYLSNELIAEVSLESSRKQNVCQLILSDIATRFNTQV